MGICKRLVAERGPHQTLAKASHDDPSLAYLIGILVVCAILLALAVAWQVRDVLMLLYVSALFAVVLTPLVERISNLRIRQWQPFKGIAILVMLVTAAAALTLFGFLALPPVLRDLQKFTGEMPTGVPALLSKLRAIPFANGFRQGL